MSMEDFGDKRMTTVIHGSEAIIIMLVCLCVFRVFVILIEFN